MLVAVVLLVAVSVWKVEGFQQRNRIVHDYCFRDALHPLKRTPTILQVVQFDEDTNDLKITPLTTTREPGSISRRVAVTGLATNIGGLFLPGVNLAFAEDDQNSPVEEEPNSLAEWTDVVGAEETEEEESTTKEPIEYVIRDFTVLLPNHWEITKSYDDDNGEENGGEFSTPTLFSATDFTTGSTLTVVEEEACELDQDNNSNKCDFIESEGASPIFSEESFEKDVSKLLRRHDDRNSAVLKGVSTLDTINLDGRISNFATDLDSSLTSATYYETSLTVLDLKATTSYQDGMGLDQPSDSDRKVLAKAVATTTTITRTKEERSSNLSIKEEDDVEVAEETSEIIGSDENEEELEPLVSSDSSFRDATEPSNEPTISDDISDSNVESIADASSIDPFSSDVEESVETSESKLTSMMSLLASILTDETEETESLETSEAESTVVVEEERKLEENTPSNEETEEIVPSETIADNASDSILEEPTQALSEEEPKTETDEIAEAILSSQDNENNADDATEQVGGDIADDAMEQVVGDNADDVTEEVGGDIADEATEQFRQDNTEDSMAAFGQDNAEDSTAKVDESKEKPSETPSPDMETAAPPEQTSKVMTTATTSKIISIWLSAPMDEWDREGSKLQSIWEGIRYTNISKESPNNEKESKDDDDALNSQLLLMNRSVLPR